jgi:hypothetical protein
MSSLFSRCLWAPALEGPQCAKDDYVCTLKAVCDDADILNLVCESERKQSFFFYFLFSSSLWIMRHPTFILCSIPAYVFYLAPTFVLYLVYFRAVSLPHLVFSFPYIPRVLICAPPLTSRFTCILISAHALTHTVPLVKWQMALRKSRTAGSSRGNHPRIQRRTVGRHVHRNEPAGLADVFVGVPGEL